VVRAAGVLLLVELAQGVIGVVQHATHLPALAVGLHMAGAGAVWLATIALADRVWPVDGAADRSPTEAAPVAPVEVSARA